VSTGGQGEKGKKKKAQPKKGNTGSKASTGKVSTGGQGGKGKMTKRNTKGARVYKKRPTKK
jgi:hypothetical protein